MAGNLETLQSEAVLPGLEQLICEYMINTELVGRTLVRKAPSTTARKAKQQKAGGFCLKNIYSI